MEGEHGGNGKRLAAGGADRAIRIWNVETGEQELLIEDHADWVMGVAWSPDGKARFCKSG